MTKLKTLTVLLTTLLLAGLGSGVKAQNVVLHSNLALWAGQGANIGVDFAVNDYMTVGGTALMSIGESWFKEADINGMQLDARFWLSRKLLQSFFVGPQVGLYHYRLGEDSSVKRHTAFTAGLEAGYGWMLSRHWNLDLSYGAGYLFYADPKAHNRFTMTSVGLNISYVF